MLEMPPALDQRLFYSQQAIAEHNDAVAAYLEQQEAASYKHSKNQKRKQRYDSRDSDLN